MYLVYQIVWTPKNAEMHTVIYTISTKCAIDYGIYEGSLLKFKFSMVTVGAIPAAVVPWAARRNL